MDPVRVHLALNHVPVLFTILATVIFGWGMLRRLDEIKRIGAAVFVVAALVCIPVFLTGEPAEERVEHLPGVIHDTIEAHEDAGKYALIAIEILGALSLGVLWFLRVARKPPRLLSASTLAVAILTSILLVWTANLGARIRHTELVSPAAAVSQPQAEGGQGQH